MPSFADSIQPCGNAAGRILRAGRDQGTIRCIEAFERSKGPYTWAIPAVTRDSAAAQDVR